MARARKTINLALQGGGAHGAYAWGVLDALLEDGRVGFEGVCSTSAGSLNAAALAYGLTTGDNDTAREVLQNLWRQIAAVGSVFAPIKTLPWPVGSVAHEAMNFRAFEAFTNTLSPYQFNPLNINLLQQVVENVMDVRKIRECTCVKLFITATDVQTRQGVSECRYVARGFMRIKRPALSVSGGKDKRA
jgi:NTE family protein